MRVDILDERTDESRLVHLVEPSRVARNATSRRRPQLRRTAGISLLAVAATLGAFVFFLFTVSGLVESRSQRLLLAEYRGLADGGPASTLDWRPLAGQPMGLISIPRLGVDAVVVEGTSASETMQGPAHYRDSSMPGHLGNTVIVGRRTTFGSPFADLGRLQAGDDVEISTGAGMFTYIVQTVGLVRPSDTDAVSQTSDNRLTLMTSSPAYSASGRLIVVAALQGPPATGTLDPPTIVPANETGLSGEPSAVAAAIVLAELVAAAVVAGMWLRRKLSPRVAWLFATPIAVAVVWSLFLAVARLLPATL